MNTKEQQQIEPANWQVAQGLINYALSNIRKYDKTHGVSTFNEADAFDMLNTPVPEFAMSMANYLNQNADHLSRLGGHGHFTSYNDKSDAPNSPHTIRNFEDGYNNIAKDSHATEQQRIGGGLQVAVGSLFGAELNRINMMASPVTARDGREITMDPGTPLPKELQDKIKHTVDEYIAARNAMAKRTQDTPTGGM